MLITELLNSPGTSPIERKENWWNRRTSVQGELRLILRESWKPWPTLHELLHGLSHGLLHVLPCGLLHENTDPYSVNYPTDYPMDYSIDCPVHYCADYAMDYPMEDPTDCSMDYPTDYSTDYPTDPSTDHPMDYSMDYSIDYYGLGKNIRTWIYHKHICVHDHLRVPSSLPLFSGSFLISHAE